MFIKSIREGRDMPWPAFAHMTDEDLRSVFAFLRSLLAISYQVPEYVEAEQSKQ
jgi:hypothetical protein